MSDPLNRYMRRSGRLAPLCLSVSHPFCAETIRDSCNSSLQLLPNTATMPPYQCLIRVPSVARQPFDLPRS
jgi:hypothetical protein